VTDLGRRNISRVVGKLGVENIIVAADIEQKRRFVRKNVLAWLNRPSLGMVSLFTAGDKHFFRYIEQIKEELGVTLNMWSVNPLEVTHFKAGFLGVAPDFQEDRVYMSGLKKQMEYQKLRFGEMMRNPMYFNNSLFDTLQGEYYRSFNKKSDYYHLFDFYKWQEDEIDTLLKTEYEWELAPDTSTTWRIGDGTAAFYNYIYRTVAGFTEHDTFRSNQIREGDITRDEALALIAEENQPRYETLKWYLDLLDLDFQLVIKKINSIPRLY
jgi:glutamine---fructose-6-phosphate transaminase (isomerizing)